MKWSIAVAAMLLAGCGGAGTTARMRFEELHVETGRVYIEGAYQYVEVRPTGDDEPDFVLRLDAGRAERAIAPGRYTVVSYTRGCSARCPSMDPWRNGHCQRRLEVREHATVMLTISTTVGRRCIISR